MEPRKEREKSFHDALYLDNRSRQALKYYSVAENSKEMYKKLLSMECPGKEVLDYGCGTGSRACWVAKSGGKVTGIDISQQAIKLARQHSVQENVVDATAFFEMDAERMTFPDNSFDLVCGTGILHHLNLDKAYPEIVRVLRPKGKAIFLEPLGHNPIINMYRFLTPHMRTKDEHPLLLSDARLAEQYFHRVELQFFHLFVLLGAPFHRSKTFSVVLQVLNGMDSLILKFAPFIRRMAWTLLIIADQPRKPVKEARQIH